MGALMSKMWFMLFPAAEYKIVVVGLDNAGKTTTLYKLHLGRWSPRTPLLEATLRSLFTRTLDSSLTSWYDFFGLEISAYTADSILDPKSFLQYHTIVLEFVDMSVWDLGGQDRLRTSWATYYRGTHAVIVVIDSTDRARISIMKDELFSLLPHEDLQSAVILVFANKQDLQDAMTPAEITDALSLHSIKKHDWHIQACCAVTGEGLYDGLGWIAQRVTGKAPS
ncbi:hypothetical protein DH2020_004839 [Rehmannia glutinosa]|uniref:ADP-ribosylation factor-like protein 5 n=1 Tax=Rehmannia glutinosa TaxID=99300 RepID=A0ABR0XQU2_REHGL